MGRKGAQSSFVASVTALRTVVSCLTDMDIREPDIRSCGDNMVNMFDTDEEHFAVSSSSAADTAFDGVIGCIEDIIMEDDFQQLQQIFMEKHYREFDDSDENKLSYTPIFNEYIDLLEKYLEQQLMERIPGFNMDTFKELLMQHKEEVSGDIFDMLLTFTDFMAFKEMFLQYRAEKEGQCPDLSQGLVVTSLNLGGSKHADFNESQGISGRTSLFPFAMKV